MKAKTIIFFFVLLSYSSSAQNWYNMGNIDTIGSNNGNRGVIGISFFNNKITAGGYFKKENTTSINGIAQWNGNNWTPMGIGLWSTIASDSCGNGGRGLVEYKNKLYSGGIFQGAGGNYINDPTHYAYSIAKWDGTDWNPMTQPSDGFNSGCTALGVYHNNLYAGGAFGGSVDSFGVHSTQGISKWNDTTFSAVGQLDGDFPPWYAFNVMRFCIYQNKLIAGGAFTSIDGSPYGSYSGIAAWDDTNWSALGVGFNDAVLALTVYNGELYAGGLFTATRDNLTPLNHVAKWNGTTWQAVGDGLNDTVYTLCVDSLQNKLYAGGAFTQTGLGIQARHLAEWTGTNWQEVGGGTNRDVAALFSKDSNLYVGGTFTRAGNIQASLIACWGYGLSVGEKELGMRNEELGIVPNPCASQLGIMNYELGIKEVKIYNMLGEVVKEFKMENNEITINIEHFRNGIYFIELKNIKGTVRKKFIKN